MEENNRILYLTEEMLKGDAPIWVNPVGGMGDILMLSTALKRSYDKYGKKFCVARRSQYTQFFRYHPAVETIGHPPVDALVVCNDYWCREEFKDVNNKALAIMLKIFGIIPDSAIPSGTADSTDETLYLPENQNDDAATRLLLENVPWTDRTVVIAFNSESPRKVMHPLKWHIIVDQLRAQQCFVVQVGRLGEPHIIGAYSLLGCTSPMQVISVVKKARLVITPDNFVMHAAQLVKVPAIALFGPTEKERYGYSDHICLQADKEGCNEADHCLGPHVPQNYGQCCPLGERACMNRHDEGRIIDIALSLLNS